MVWRESCVSDLASAYSRTCSTLRAGGTTPATLATPAMTRPKFYDSRQIQLGASFPSIF